MRRLAVVAALVGVLITAPGCGGSSGGATASTTSRGSSLRPYSQLSAAERSQRAQDCRNVQTVYGAGLTAMTSGTGDDATRSIAHLEALAHTLPAGPKHDLEVIAATAKSIHDDPKNVLKVGSNEVTAATAGMQDYIQRLCDVTS